MKKKCIFFFAASAIAAPVFYSQRIFTVWDWAVGFYFYFFFFVVLSTSFYGRISLIVFFCSLATQQYNAFMTNEMIHGYQTFRKFFLNTQRECMSFLYNFLVFISLFLFYELNNFIEKLSSLKRKKKTRRVTLRNKSRTEPDTTNRWHKN